MTLWAFVGKNNSKGKWLPAFVVVCCLSSAAFAKSGKCEPRKNCVQVPDGGSAAVYLLGAGLTCVGAMFVRSRLAKPAQEQASSLAMNNWQLFGIPRNQNFRNSLSITSVPKRRHSSSL
jgi:hypothetical protein